MIQDIVLIPCLIITVAYIDSLSINHIVRIALSNSGVSIVLRSSGIVLSSIGIFISAEVLHSGRRMVILQESIHDSAGRVDLAHQDIRHSVDARHAHITDP